MKNGIELIAEERQRQMEVEGWSLSHDQLHHPNEQLALAAAAYAMPEETRQWVNDTMGNDMFLHFWPFELAWWKPSPEDRIRELQKAGALIAAEIDRIQLDQRLTLAGV